MSKTAQPLSIEQINRAIVIDFEGFMDRPPSLVGTLIDNYYRCTVFTDVDPALAIAADATGCVKAHLQAFLIGMIRFAIKEGRHIAAYSERERNVFRDLGLGDLSNSPRFINVRPPAKRWRRHVHPEAAQTAVRTKMVKGRKVKVGNRLVDFMPLLDQSIPSTHAAGKTTKRLRDVIGQLNTRGSYAALTPTAKRKWTNLIKHNQRDCAWASLLLTASAGF